MPADLAAEVMCNLLVGRTRDEIDSIFARLAERMQHTALETPGFMTQHPSAQEFGRGEQDRLSVHSADLSDNQPVVRATRMGARG